MTRRRLLCAGLLFVTALLATFAGPFAVRAASADLPERLTDQAFWAIPETFSEPGGTFHSDNFISNEGRFQLVIPELVTRVKPGGLYIGVGPEQNFTYLAAVRPKMAFIIDIRRGNLQEHLLYKALMELSADRAEFLSRLFSRVYYYLLRKLVLPGYPAGGFDLAMMDKAMLAPLRDSAKSAFLPLLAYWLGYQPSVIRYSRRPRLHGKSRWTLRKKFRAFVDVMLGFSVTPIRAISAVGVIVSLVSFLYGAAVVVAALVGDIPVPGFSTLVALVTFLLGLIILMLGVIGEYLWRIFDESNGRPEAVVDEVY